ncbi:hypothetical protein C7S15_3523 [Burkholderia cepacia]|nr:hypothetical protein [Burkholderia cepacia]
MGRRDGGLGVGAMGCPPDATKIRIAGERASRDHSPSFSIAGL